MVPNPDAAVPTKEVRKLAHFHYDELIRGKKLGQGAFSDVYEVKQFEPRKENEENLNEALEALRYYAGKATEESTHTRHKKYAIKCVKDHFDDPKMFRFAARDMEIETKLLSKIDHPNIIKVYGTSASETKASECKKENAHDFFIVVDRLSGTLTDKIAHWKREKQSLVGKPFSRFVDHSQVVKKHELLMAPLRIALNVASALAYLHEEDIIYRDLKADNVGFDFDGHCKLFDFGLARRLPRDPEMKRMNDTYVMSGKTGNLMFMAPEVYNEQPYNQKADVYSMAMLLWKMLALELPYLEYTYDREVFDSKVFQKGKRPTIQGKWPKKIQILLKRAWSKDMDERPTMQEVCIMLKEAIASVQPPKTARRSAFM